ncbi:MAG: hypothetical protein J7K68_03605 [Candidatus Diapherotrites archaeon]|nr:hypothetical protein [Candidatus Diapherotrites archaeon]
MKKYETTQPRIGGNKMRCSCGSVPVEKIVKVKAFDMVIGQYHEYRCKRCGKQWFNEAEVSKLKKAVDWLYLPKLNGDSVIKYGEQKRLTDFHVFRYGVVQLE